MKFTYYNPVKICFGVDYLEAIKDLASKLKDARFLLVTSKGFSKRGLSDKVANVLGKQLVGIVDEILPNPQIRHLQWIKANLCEFDAIVALGGGSVIDSAKFLISNSSLTQDTRIANDSKDSSLRGARSEASATKQSKSHESKRQSESITQIQINTNSLQVSNSPKSQSLPNGLPRFGVAESRNDSILDSQNDITQEPNIPIYAIPTTSGTSSELTHWATIWDNENFIKHSLSDESLYPKIAFYDPHLTLSLPRETTIHTALDALSHSFESIWNKSANPISTHYALVAIEIILRDLGDLAQNLDLLPLRTSIMQASMYAGLAFSNTQTALAHALSYPLTMRFSTSHGLACSFSLPLLLECLPPSKARDLLLPFQARLLGLFEKLEISTNPKDYGLDSAFVEEIFATLNPRAKNGIFDIEGVKNALLKYM